MMELDDLRADWAARDGKLADAIRLNASLLKAELIDRQMDRLRRSGGMGGFGLTVWIFFLVAFGAFTAAHFGEWRFFIPGLVLQVWTIAMGVITFRERDRLRAVDFDRCVLEIQERLATLRIERARTVQWAFLTGQLVWWIPFFIICCKGLLGVDLYAVSDFMPRFIAINLIVGLAFIPAALLAGRLVRRKFAGSPLSNRFIDAITGGDMAEAKRFAERVALFERGADA